MIISLKDFYGVLLGTVRIVDKDNNENSEIEDDEEKESIGKANYNYNIFINIDHIHNIFNIPSKEDIPSLIKEIENKNQTKTILSYFTAKINSFPYLSLKDQEAYFELKSIVNESHKEEIEFDQQIPFLYFSFCFGKDENTETNQYSFQSKMYYYNDNNNNFEHMKFKMFNLKMNQYENTVELVSNLQSDNHLIFDLTTFENEVKKVKEEINNSLEEIENNLSIKLYHSKKMLIKEIDNYNKLLQRLNNLRNKKK